MRIIKRGIHPDEIVCTGTCYTCKTEVEFTRGESKKHYDQRDGNSFSVQCPCCKGTIYASTGTGSNGFGMWGDR